MPPTAESWEDVFRRLVCELLRRAGGDCADLPWDCNERVKAVVAKYEVNGAPDDLNEEQRAEFVQLLRSCEGHLNQPGNSLEPFADSLLRNLLKNLLEAFDS